MYKNRLNLYNDINYKSQPEKITAYENVFLALKNNFLDI